MISNLALIFFHDFLSIFLFFFELLLPFIVFIFKFAVFFKLFEPALLFPFPELLNLPFLQIFLMLLFQVDVFEYFVPNFFFLLFFLQKQLNLLFLFGRKDSTIGILISSTI